MVHSPTKTVPLEAPLLYTSLTKAAMRYCYECHHGQVDKSGVPYVFHPAHVAEQMETEAETCAALLHDVMEDCGKTEADLAGIGMPAEVIEALRLLNHRPGVPYLDYVRALRDNDIARKVKLADLEHNSDVSRLGEVGERDRDRVRKYEKARAMLEGQG